MQRRVVDFTSTVARNLQARTTGGWHERAPAAASLTRAHLQLRMTQGDSWDEPTLLPTQGAALDVRARVSVRLRAALTRRRRSCCRPLRIPIRQPPVLLPSSCTSARTRCVRSRRVRSCSAAYSPPARCAPQSRSYCGRRRDGACSRDRKSGSSRCGTVRLPVPTSASLPCSHAARRHVVQLRDHFAGARHRHPCARVEPQ